MASILKIKNTIAYLEQHDPAGLEKLRQQYAGKTDVLEGAETYGAEDHADTPAKQQAVLQASILGLKKLVTEAAPLQASLRSRLARAKNLNTIAAIIALFSGTVLVVLIGTKSEALVAKLTVALVNLAATALPLVAKWLETSKYGDGRNMADYLVEVNAAFADAEMMELKLQEDFTLGNYDKDTVDRIKRTEEIQAKIVLIKQQLQ